MDVLSSWGSAISYPYLQTTRHARRSYMSEGPDRTLELLLMVRRSFFSATLKFRRELNNCQKKFPDSQHSCYLISMVSYAPNRHDVGNCLGQFIMYGSFQKSGAPTYLKCASQGFCFFGPHVGCSLVVGPMLRSHILRRAARTPKPPW